MSDNAVRETCSCGAEFNWQGTYAGKWVSDALERWREAHKHADMAGICGDLSETLVMADGGEDVAFCDLKAGHSGMHSDGSGRHWTRPTWTTGAAG